MATLRSCTAISYTPCRNGCVAQPDRGGDERAGALKSLHQFVAEKRAPLAVRFDVNPPSLQTVDTRVRRGRGSEPVRYPLLSLPLYLVERLPRILHGNVWSNPA